jgi:hypothetical protein
MLRVSDCVRDRIRLAIPQPTEWQRIGNQIDAAFIFARADFWSAAVLFGLRLDSEMLLFALEKKPIEQQQDHGAYDRHNPARWLSGLIPADGLAEVSGNERPRNAEQNRDDKTTRIFPRHQQLRDCAHDKTDKNGRKNSHSERRCIRLIRAQQEN